MTTEGARRLDALNKTHPGHSCPHSLTECVSCEIVREAAEKLEAIELRCEHNLLPEACVYCLRATVKRLTKQRLALMTAIKAIEGNCLTWQSGESEMSAGDFLALIQLYANEAMR